MKLVCVLLFGGILATSAAHADQEPDLIDNMVAMQYFLHKLSLSVSAGNYELADFYAHELEETIEDAETISDYHGHPIGQLVTRMLVPTFDAFEDALDEGQHDDLADRLDQVISSCNACHSATGYDVIHIKRNAHNPYMQSFRPRNE